MTLLFVTGVFRSGTTMLARALNAHAAVACASDPLGDLLKAFRSHTAAGLGVDATVSAPLADYYFDAPGQAVHRAIQDDATLDAPVSPETWAALRDSARVRCASYAQALLSELDAVSGDSFRGILGSFAEAVRRAYGGERTQWIGVKEVWSTEFIPVLARAFPHARFIVMQRDPRAVCASKNTRDQRYPWLFMARQWRKSAALAHSYAGRPDLSARMMPLAYETLIEKPEETFGALCTFLRLDWDPALVDPNAYRDGEGRPWRQNTAYGGGGLSYDRSALDRWREVLTEPECRLIETVCGPEMALAGYRRACRPGPDDEAVLLDPPRIDDAHLAGWMRGVVPNDAVSDAAALAQEVFRARALDPSERALPRAVQRAAFLETEVYRALRAGPAASDAALASIGEAR